MKVLVRKVFGSGRRPATRAHFVVWIGRRKVRLPSKRGPKGGVAHTKLRQFAAEAAALEVSELLDISQPGKRHTLLLALLRQARMRCRDEPVEMMLRRVRRTQAATKEQLEALHDQQRETEEALIGIFGQVCCKRHKPERPTTPSGVR